MTVGLSLLALGAAASAPASAATLVSGSFAAAISLPIVATNNPGVGTVLNPTAPSTSFTAFRTGRNGFFTTGSTNNSFTVDGPLTLRNGSAFDFTSAFGTFDGTIADLRFTNAGQGRRNVTFTASGLFTPINLRDPARPNFRIVPGRGDVTFSGSLGGGGASNGSFTFAARLAAVPEPATWAMMIGGFGLTGLASRRRRLKALSA